MTQREQTKTTRITATPPRSSPGRAARCAPLLCLCRSVGRQSPAWSGRGDELGPLLAGRLLDSSHCRKILPTVSTHQPRCVATDADNAVFEAITENNHKVLFPYLPQSREEQGNASITELI